MVTWERREKNSILHPTPNCGFEVEIYIFKKTIFIISQLRKWENIIKI